MTAKVMKSLDEYEQLLAPVRECFAISPGVQAINSSSNDVFLESFLLHFCALNAYAQFLGDCTELADHDSREAQR